MLSSRFFDNPGETPSPRRGVAIALALTLALALPWGCSSPSSASSRKEPKGTMLAQNHEKAKTQKDKKAVKDTSVDEEAKGFLDEMTKKLQPLTLAWNKAQWKAYTSGKKEDYAAAAKHELAVKQLLGNKEHFATIKELRKDTYGNPLIERQLDLLYNSFLPNQIEPALMKSIIEKSSEAERIFGTFRGKIGDKEVSSNEINRILKEEKDSEKRKQAWEASKQVGAALEPVLKELIVLRNKAAKSLGFDNFYAMTLASNDQTVEEIQGIFDELAKATEKPFQEVKKEADAYLAKRFGVKVEELKPWHYEDPFFQEAPAIYGLNQDQYLKDKDPKAIVTAFFKSLKMDPEAEIGRAHV